MICYSCKYYEMSDHMRGFCHRYPPDNGITKVRGDWWCGEYERYLERITIEGEGENLS